MHGDEQRYFDLLIALDGLLYQAESILDAHAGCPGCGLCRDATSIEYFTDMLLDLIIGDAPEEMHGAIETAYQSSKRRDSTANGPEPPEHPPPSAQP